MRTIPFHQTEDDTCNLSSTDNKPLDYISFIVRCTVLISGISRSKNVARNDIRNRVRIEACTKRYAAWLPAVAARFVVRGPAELKAAGSMYGQGRH